MNHVQQAQQLGQSTWIDYLRRGLLVSGEFDRFLCQGVTGFSAGAAMYQKVISGSPDYDEVLAGLLRDGKKAREAYETILSQDIRDAADRLRGVYDLAGGTDGLVCLECPPETAHDTGATVSEVRRLYSLIDRPNIMFSVPATPEGIAAAEQLISQGFNVNITLIFDPEVYRQVCQAYINGLEQRAEANRPLRPVVSVASLVMSRFDAAVDAYLEDLIKRGRSELSTYLTRAAVANARITYQLLEQTFTGERFARLQEKGAGIQRLGWSGTVVANPVKSDLLYVEPLIGPNTVNIMSPSTLNAFLEHGEAKNILEKDVPESRQTWKILGEAGVNQTELAGRLLHQGITDLARSFQQVLVSIEEKQSRLEVGRFYPGITMEKPFPDCEKTLDELSRQSAVSRIWAHDYTLWKPEPTEIADRMGWLDIPEQMVEPVPALNAFARDVWDAGFRQVVLLGMGGSSLGPETLRQVFGSASGFPELFVLDSTVPAQVSGIVGEIDVPHTLFLVSSRSGSTIETISLYGYFKGLAESVMGGASAQNFVAITTPGSPLEAVAREEGFRWVFLNSPNIGGRYSVFSYFGLVPAALMGIDLARLLDRANNMRAGCAACLSPRQNHGGRLGALMACLAQAGKDKLTLVTSPAIASFGLWIEQMLAESTGKEGKGIIPIAGEPLLAPEYYGDDRFFVYLRLASDDNAPIDAAIGRLKSAGQIVADIELADRYDIGAEFFRWEFATAVAGAVLGINPFNQPNVQESKLMARKMLWQYQADGRLPAVPASVFQDNLMAEVKPGEYLAIMAYTRQTPRIDRALTELRRQVMQRYHIATSAGYGPRFLHSTGQLHKGGPGTGRFLQLIGDNSLPLPVPGEDYSLGILTDAEALGDLQTLQSRGRRIFRVQLEEDIAGGIEKLVLSKLDPLNLTGRLGVD